TIFLDTATPRALSSKRAGGLCHGPAAHAPVARKLKDGTRKTPMAAGQKTAVVTAWPALPYAAWRDTGAALHQWAQIVGKVRLMRAPWINHSWHATLYVTARGLTTSPIPDGGRVFEIDFDFIDHALVIRVSDGSERRLALTA